ncbi:MAG: peptidyl-prolyl cis-trans isomerase [Lentisphaeria bacterium]|nr:peptidyl-prolyl cis-trans isomerase [Lentisphaeria bacterium]
MFITRFNRFFERHSRMIYIGLGVVISLSFVVFVTPGSMRDIGSGRSLRGSIGSMYGRSIPQKDFVAQLRLVDLSNYLRTGEFMSRDSAKFPDLVRETLQRLRSLHEASRRGLDVVGREELEDLLLRIFSRDGVYDRESFLRFRQNVLYRNGYDGADLDETLRQSIVLSRLEEDVSYLINVSPNEARDLFDQFYEEFVLRYAVVRADVAKDGAPSDEDVAAYFAAHREDLRTPAQRRVRVAQFTGDAYKDKVELADKDIEEHYERLKATSYKGKALEDVRPQIVTILTNQKARGLAAEAVRAFLDAFRAAAPEKESAAELSVRFAQACKDAGLETTDTGAFGEEGTVPGLGKFPGFQRQAYVLTEEGPLSNVIYDAGRYFAACWLETIPGTVPEELDDTMRKSIRDLLLDEEARKLYAEKVEPYREPLATCEAAWDLTSWYDEELARKEPGLSEEEKEKRRSAFRDQIRDYILPYFVKRQKMARIVAFRPAAYEKDITVSDEQIKTYFDENSATYKKEEMRARQIMVVVPPSASDTDKAGKRAILEKALDELGQGAPFEQVAGAYSEEAASKAQGGDMGFFARGAKPKAVEDAAFGMEVGEISGIVEIPGGLVVLKVEEKRAGKALADVREEIRRKIIESEADKRALADATAFQEAVAAEWDKAKGSGAVPGDILKAQAEAKGYNAQDSNYFMEGGVVVPFGNETALSRDAFALTPESPISAPIKGRKDVYVACFLDTKAPELPSMAEDETLLRRVVSRVRRDRAIAAARAKGTQAHATIAEALKAGKSFDEAVATLEGIEFKTSDPFTRNRPPQELPLRGDAMKSLEDASPGTLLEPLEDSNGAAVMYVVSRTLPAEDRFEAERERFENQAQWSKRYAIMQAFQERLEKESATVLKEPWKSHAEAPPAPRSGGPGGGRVVMR